MSEANALGMALPTSSSAAGFHDPHPGKPPYGRPAVVQFGSPADLSWHDWLH
jgi:hypothetical protein